MHYNIGTAGWSYKDWVPVFYPQSLKAKNDWLPFYAQYFNIVEVNATYYTYLPQRTAYGWLEKTAPSLFSDRPFRFTVKLHQDFTHKRKFDPACIKAATDLLLPLAQEERLGGLLIQFPYSFGFNSVSASYIRVLFDIFSRFPLFFELRHASWDSEEARTALGELPVTVCAIDQPALGAALPFRLSVSAERLYIRLHGRNIAAWKASVAHFGTPQSPDEQNERYRYLYSASELIEIAQKVQALRAQAKEIFVILNNHPGGNAVVNAFDLIRLLEERIPEMPETIRQFQRTR